MAWLGKGSRDRLRPLEDGTAMTDAPADDPSNVLVELRQVIAELQERVAEQASALDRQAVILEQLQADFARVQRQAERDIAEMRETNTAVIASVLLRRVTTASDG